MSVESRARAYRQYCRDFWRYKQRTCYDPPDTPIINRAGYTPDFLEPVSIDEAMFAIRRL